MTKKQRQERLKAFRERILTETPDHELERLSVKQYAERRGVSAKSIYTAIREDRFPYPVDRPTGGDLIVLLVPRSTRLAS